MPNIPQFQCLYCHRLQYLKRNMLRYTLLGSEVLCKYCGKENPYNRKDTP